MFKEEHAMKRYDRYALISVSDKTGIVPFAKGLRKLGFGIISTGGTATELKGAGIEVVDISSVTGLRNNMMDGRVKTLHHRIAGGILAQTYLKEHCVTMIEEDINPIDFVICNLYPFKETAAKPGCTLAQAIENIDIGGPTMLRAGAKNHERVAVICDPSDYNHVLAEMQEDVKLTQEFRFELACKAFAHTASYDTAIAKYLANQLPAEAPYIVRDTLR